MEPALPIWIPWALITAGAVLGTPYVRRVFWAGINDAAFTANMRKLFAEGNADRAPRRRRTSRWASR